MGKGVEIYYRDNPDIDISAAIEVARARHGVPLLDVRHLMANDPMAVPGHRDAVYIGLDLPRGSESQYYARGKQAWVFQYGTHAPNGYDHQCLRYIKFHYTVGSLAAAAWSVFFHGYPEPDMIRYIGDSVSGTYRLGESTRLFCMGLAALCPVPGSQLMHNLLDQDRDEFRKAFGKVSEAGRLLRSSMERQHARWWREYGRAVRIDVPGLHGFKARALNMFTPEYDLHPPDLGAEIYIGHILARDGRRHLLDVMRSYDCEMNMIDFVRSCGCDCIAGNKGRAQFWSERLPFIELGDNNGES